MKTLNLKSPAEKQRILRDFVDREVLLNQTGLVNYILEKGLVDYEDISNIYYTHEELNERYPGGYGTDEESDVKEIYEWWLVSDWLLERLKEKGEPALETDFGSWWGRTCSGQAIYLDAVIEEIYDDLQR